MTRGAAFGVLIGSVFGGGRARAAEECVIRGEVRSEETKSPLSGVIVSERGSGRSASTDEDGRFEIAVRRGAPLLLDARGEAIVATSFALGTLCPATLVILDARFRAKETKEVTVVGRSPPSGSVVSLEAAEINAFPRRSGEDALRLVPGITLVQHGSEGKGTQFFLRGFDAMHGADLEVSLGDIPLNEWSNVHAQGYVDLGFILPEVTRRVTVEKGPFSLAAGAFATAGSVRYELGVPDDRRGSYAGYTLGTTNRHRAVFTHSPRSGRDFLAFEALHDDGFGSRRGLDRTSTTGRVEILRTRDFGSVELLGAVSAARFELPSTLRAEDVATGRIDRFGSYETQGRGLSARSLFGLTHELSTHDFRWTTTTFVQLRTLELDENFTGSLLNPGGSDLRRQEQHAVTYGLSAAHERRFGKLLGGEFRLGMRGEALTTERGLVDGPTSGSLDERLALEQALFSGAGGLVLRLPFDVRARIGLRADGAALSALDRDSPSRTARAFSGALSPRGSLEWQTLPDLRVYGSAGQGFRPPEARALLAENVPVVGTSDELRPAGQPRVSTSTSLEFGATYSPVRELRIRGTTFLTFVERETIYDHVSGLNLELNSTERLGVEAEVLWTPVSWASFLADATWVDARFAASGSPIPFVPPLTGGLRGFLTHPSGLTGSLRLRTLASRPLPHGARGAAWAALDGSVGYSSAPYSLTLEVENLLDLAYPEGEYHYTSRFGLSSDESTLPTLHFSPGPPRNARLTFAIRF